MDLTGAELGVFEVWGPISEGGMSRVWLARHRELSVPVIVKTLLGECAQEEAFTRLRNEARLTARIPSHRVVHAVDVGIYEGSPYLAQEYIDGLDMAELDRRRRETLGRALPLWFVCSVAHQVAEALHCAHQTGVLHRDVKPSNLFGSPQTGVRLGDFGIAVARGSRHEENYGTLRFVSPESLRGESPTRRCDVYSFGATVFDLYYGSPPLVRLDEILTSAPLPFPSPRSPEEAAFQHVLRCMLDPVAERRVASVRTPQRQFAALAQALAPELPCVHLGPGDYQLGPLRVRCLEGDIAEDDADGIVNSANDEMKMRSGVGAALRKRGGQIIEDEAMAEGGRALGECVATSAGGLKAKHVLHAVSAWKEASCIARASQRAFLLAEKLGISTLAVPALGTGFARITPEACAYAVASALYQHVLLGGSRLREVRFVLYDKETYEVFLEELNGVLLGSAELLEAFAPVRHEPALEETEHLRVRSGGIQSRG